jgi:hypothetical protein
MVGMRPSAAMNRLAMSDVGRTFLPTFHNLIVFSKHDRKAAKHGHNQRKLASMIQFHQGTIGSQQDLGISNGVAEADATDLGRDGLTLQIVHLGRMAHEVEVWQALVG